MKIAHYEQMMDYLTGPRERFRDGGRIGFKKGTPFQITDEKLAKINELIKETNLDLKSIGKQIGYGTDKTQLKIDAPVMKAYIEKYGKPKPGRLKPANLAKDPEYVQFVIDKVKELGSKKAAAKELKIDRKTINNILKQKAPGLMKPENIPGPETGAKAIKKRSKQIIKEGEKKAGPKTTNQARKVIDSIADRNKVYANMSAEELAKDKNFLNRLRVTINNRTGAVDFTGYTETNPVRGKVFNDIELAQHAINKANNGELFTHDHITPKRFRKQNIQYPINFQPVTYMENSQFENARTYLTNNPTDNVTPINNYLKSNNKTIRFENNKYGYTGNIVYNSDTGNQTLLEFEKRTNVGGRGEIEKSLALIGCGNADGGRIKFQTGATPTAQCIARGVEKINTGNIKAGAEARNASQFLNRAYKVGRGILKFGVIPEAIFVTGESLVRMGMGDTLDESLLRATDYLLPGNQSKTADKQKLVRTVGEANADTVMRANDYKQALQNLDDVKVNTDIDIQQNNPEFTGVSNEDLLIAQENKIKQAQQNIVNTFQPEAVMDFATMKEAESADIAKSRSFFPKFLQQAKDNQIVDDIETLRAPGEKQKGIADSMFTMDDLAGVVISDDMLQAEKNRLGGAPEFTKRNQFDFLRQTNEDYNNAVLDLVFKEGRKNFANRERLLGTQGSFGGQPIPQKPMYDFAGGGIAKLAGKSSGRPPESGPTPQGLDFLIKRGRKQ